MQHLFYRLSVSFWASQKIITEFKPVINKTNAVLGWLLSEPLQSGTREVREVCPNVKQQSGIRVKLISKTIRKAHLFEPQDFVKINFIQTILTPGSAWEPRRTNGVRFCGQREVMLQVGPKNHSLTGPSVVGFPQNETIIPVHPAVMISVLKPLHYKKLLLSYLKADLVI